MKKLIKTITLVSLISLPLICVAAGPINDTPISIHKVVFEVTIDGAEKWEGVLRNVVNVQKSLGAKTIKIEVVTHGKGIGMLVDTKVSSIPEMKATIQKLHESGVVFAVCENTMKRMHINKDQLVPLAATVDSGVSEVIRKQESGYAYIKIGE